MSAEWLEAKCGQAFEEPCCASVRLARIAEPGQVSIFVRREGALELDAQKPSFCHEAAALLLDIGERFLEAFVREDQHLSEQEPIFRAAKREGGRALRDVFERKVRVPGFEGACKTCAVHIDRDIMGVCPICKRKEALVGPDAADLGRVGDVDERRLCHMPASCALALPDAFCSVRGDESVCIVSEQDRPAGCCDSSGLMCRDMGKRGCDDTFPVTEHAGDCDEVDRSAADTEFHSSIGEAHGVSDEGACPLAVDISFCIAGALLLVRVDESLEHLWGGTFRVIVPEHAHGQILSDVWTIVAGQLRKMAEPAWP